MFQAAKPCVRCVVTTTDQETGARAKSKEPLRTLSKVAYDETLKGPIFGMNMFVVEGAGEFLESGMEAEILES